MLLNVMVGVNWSVSAGGGGGGGGEGYGYRGPHPGEPVSLSSNLRVCLSLYVCVELF